MYILISLDKIIKWITLVLLIIIIVKFDYNGLHKFFIFVLLNIILLLMNNNEHNVIFAVVQ